MKLTKEQEKRRSEIIDALRAAGDKLSSAVGEYNGAVDQAWLKVDAAKGAYEEALSEAHAFAAEVASDADSEISEKSEKWQESERGEAAISWKDEWENAELPEELDGLEEPEQVELPELDHADALEQLPGESEA